jgi:crotonobetainyl-CoA:carnitine CoA-transferase CaiB-like acyl-CoA transferase
MPARVSAWAIYDVFETADGLPLFVGVVTDALWEKFCALFGLDELWADESLRENNARVLARERILPMVRETLVRFTRDELIVKLEHSGLPFAPIGKPEELFDDPHLRETGALEPVTLPGGGATALPALPISFDQGRPGRAAHLPHAGEDTRAIMQSLGYSDERVEDLFRSGAVEESEG